MACPGQLNGEIEYERRGQSRKVQQDVIILKNNENTV